MLGQAHECSTPAEVQVNTAWTCLGALNANADGQVSLSQRAYLGLLRVLISSGTYPQDMTVAVTSDLAGDAPVTSALTSEATQTITPGHTTATAGGASWPLLTPWYGSPLYVWAKVSTGTVRARAYLTFELR